MANRDGTGTVDAVLGEIIELYYSINETKRMVEAMLRQCCFFSFLMNVLHRILIDFHMSVNCQLGLGITKLGKKTANDFLNIISGQLFCSKCSVYPRAINGNILASFWSEFVFDFICLFV